MSGKERDLEVWPLLLYLRPRKNWRVIWSFLPHWIMLHPVTRMSQVNQYLLLGELVYDKEVCKVKESSITWQLKFYCYCSICVSKGYRVNNITLYITSVTKKNLHLKLIQLDTDKTFSGSKIIYDYFTALLDWFTQSITCRT